MRPSLVSSRNVPVSGCGRGSQRAAKHTRCFPGRSTQGSGAPSNVWSVCSGSSSFSVRSVTARSSSVRPEVFTMVSRCRYSRSPVKSLRNRNVRMRTCTGGPSHSNSIRSRWKNLGSDGGVGPMRRNCIHRARPTAASRIQKRMAAAVRHIPMKRAALLERPVGTERRCAGPQLRRRRIPQTPKTPAKPINPADGSGMNEMYWALCPAGKSWMCNPTRSSSLRSAA
jgi:hypothetical protein